MALVNMKSDLSQINKNFGGNSIPEPEPINTVQGVDYFTNTNAIGFTTNRYTNINPSQQRFLTGTNFILNDDGGPIIPQINYLDIKGDTTSLFSETNRATNIYNLGDSPTPIQDRLAEGSLITGLFNYSITRPRGSFVPPNNINNRFPIDTIDVGTRSEYSRLYRKHTENNFLKDYYAQANVDTGRFGIRNDRLNRDDQPYVTRDIGQKWGIDKIQLPSPIPEFVSAAANKVLSLSAPVFGRDISVFADRYRADFTRLSGFANPTSNYVIKQIALQRRNTFDQVTSVKYGLSDIDRGNPIIDVAESLFPGAADRIGGLNPQVYNPGSVFSVPGVSGLMFNRAGRDAFAIDDFARTTVGIIGHLSVRAVALAAPASAKFISTKLGPFAASLGDKLSGFGSVVGDKLGGLSVPNVGFSNPFKGVSNPFSGISINKIADSKAGQFAKDAGSAAVRFGKGTKKVLIEANESRKKAGLLFNFEKGAAGKSVLSSLDGRAFEDLNVDKVNLIPYGQDAYQDIGYEKLDWIPFKFVDVRNNKPIVFRAILSGITDTFTPEYASERYMGRPDNVYVYQGTTREISFTFDVYPKSDSELLTLWQKLNYLAGLTYPHWDDTNLSMVSPFAKLTIGQMYTDAPGLISSLTYTVQDNGTWETEIAKLPKYIQVAVGFTYIGDRLPSAEQKHFDIPSVVDVRYSVDKPTGVLDKLGINTEIDPLSLNDSATGILGAVGISA